MRFFSLLLISLLLLACNEESSTLKPGEWRATLDLGDSKELPFNFSLSEDLVMEIRNAEEKVMVEDIVLQGDSITISHPIFEGVFKGTFTSERISGDFIKPSLDRVVPFEMVYGDTDRFKDVDYPMYGAEGVYEMEFTEDDGATFVGKAILEANEKGIVGTIRTTTGDYRYLEGKVDNDTLRLSTFDGAHAFLFEAKFRGTDSLSNGTFYSGNHYTASFWAKRNSNYELPDPDSLTFLKPGFDRFNFDFPDAEGKSWSLDDPQFKDKVVVVQIMGTWCPNCLDESKYFAKYLSENPNSDVEFIALAFEYAKTEESAFAGVSRLKNRLKLPYPIALAQFGSSDKKLANEKLPMLNHVLSYPTTIILDKSGEVRKIHTGFNGPATGEKYTEFTQEFEAFLAELSAE